ncbi:hypothetical protein [Aurantimonas coralicida]|uniref:hypothetical protein n=1 Tax=Aurantimonas coralicida TaxID=182270 RepID=UPI001D19455D|nr:hypothetical protein [Aurantimonas coralicida]MCC4296640.1 hypothetical protein [Aurantimonas coralicida]
MKSVLDGVIGDLDLTGRAMTSDGRKILAATVVLVRDSDEPAHMHGTYYRQKMRPQVDLLVHDKKRGRLSRWSLAFLAEDFCIPGRNSSDDEVLEDWVIRNREFADRLHACSEAALAAVNNGRVKPVPNDHIFDIAGRAEAPESGDDA